MHHFKRICVYCASANDLPQVYQEAAKQMGQSLVERGIGLVFGGGAVGLMGIIADTVLSGGGEVIGVIPEKLRARELDHKGCTTLHIVDNMHTRKKMMMDLADGFIALPGGYGTMEELFEATTWAQLNYHTHPVGILNVNGFYDPIVQWITHASTAGFIRPEHRDLLQIDTAPAGLLDKMTTAVIPSLDNWLPTTA
jgi:uncharacterized protein (TIGR00730 family)